MLNQLQHARVIELFEKDQMSIKGIALELDLDEKDVLEAIQAIPEPPTEDAKQIEEEKPKKERKKRKPKPIGYAPAELKAMRNRAGLSQIQVAVALGLKPTSSPCVADWERETEIVKNVPAKHHEKLLALYAGSDEEKT